MRPGQTKLKETAPKNSHRVSKCNARMFHRNISISQLSCQQSNVNVGTAFFLNFVFDMKFYIDIFIFDWLGFSNLIKLGILQP